MNVCLLSSAKAGASFHSPVLDELSGLGFRIVIYFLRPQRRQIWNRGPIVYCSAYPGLQINGELPEAVFRRNLDAARVHWLEPLQKPTGEAFRAVRGVERYGFKAVRFAGMQALGRLGAAVGRVRGLVEGDVLKRDPFERIPYGIENYAVVHALDEASVPAAKAACEKSGAVYFGPSDKNLRAGYEAAIMHWLKV